MGSYVARLATRSSPLALYQAHFVGRRLVDSSAASSYELVEVETTGDRRSEVPISELARQGVFTSEVEEAVLTGRADVAVHSAKDLPSSNLPEGLVLAAVPVRADVRDVLVGKPLMDLLPEAVIATGSIRRRIQLRLLRPDIRFVELRGNIATRLTKTPDGGASVFAYAALERLELLQHAAEVFSVETMLPQIGQGAIALRCRADDEVSLEALQAIDEERIHRAVRAERAYLARLGGGCEAPVGAYATVESADGLITLEALLGDTDNSTVVRDSLIGSDPELLGQELADRLVAVQLQQYGEQL